MLKKLTFHQYVWYFFIFSILGMFLENIFCFVTSGKIESRKGFVIGPFCPIYGVGAIVLIILLEGHKDKWYKIFLYGSFWGAAFEYIISFIMQALYGTKFWDYKTYFLNINGRTCLLFAISWGILSIILIYFLKPIIDKIVKYFESKILDIIILSFMTANAIITYTTIDLYMYRAKLGYSGVTANTAFFSNEVMEKIFPNMIYVVDDNKEMLVSECFKK